jgi:hypothetical protein
MSVEEFVLAFASIVIGLGLSDLLTSFHRLLRSASIVDWDWLALSFAALMIFLAVVMWWFSFYWYRGSAEVTLAAFLPKLLFLCISFLMMASALPDQVPASGLDLRAFYIGARAQSWGLVTALLVANSLIILWDYRSLGFVANARGLWDTIVSMVLAMACTRSRHVLLHSLAIAWIFGVTATEILFFRMTAAP